MAACHLYLITPPRLDDVAAFARDLEAALNAGPVAAVQIRLKADDGGPQDASVVREAAAALIPIIQAAGAEAILNDDPMLSAEVGADGVHVGQGDASLEDARNALGPKATVGVTCHDSRELAITAAQADASYVAFGAFFSSTTKSPKTMASLELLEWWSEIFEVPCVAIGGITPDNCAPLVKAGADFLAVSAAVWTHPQGGAAGVAAMTAAIAAAKAKK